MSPNSFFFRGLLRRCLIIDVYDGKSKQNVYISWVKTYTFLYGPYQLFSLYVNIHSVLKVVLSTICFVTTHHYNVQIKTVLWNIANCCQNESTWRMHSLIKYPIIKWRIIVFAFHILKRLFTTKHFICAQLSENHKLVLLGFLFLSCFSLFTFRKTNE